MSTVGAQVQAALCGVFGRDVRIMRREPLGGGSINSTERIRTSVGSFVVKSNPAAPPAFFRAEADGLDALRSSGTTLRLPRVIACSETEPQWIVLEDLNQEPQNPGTLEPQNPRTQEPLALGLALLHRATAPAFGFTRMTYCGTTPQDNTWTTSWVEFYGRSRLGYQLGLARESHLLDSRDVRLVERVIDHLGDWISEPREGPALIHGDLWTGNLHRDARGAPALIDPAVSYAHREAELGMMTLFGGFSGRLFEAYHEAFPLEPGWRDRNGLYQLYHLLNHLNLFGEEYRGAAMAIARRFA